jgi:hypothetical protein
MVGHGRSVDDKAWAGFPPQLKLNEQNHVMGCDETEIYEFMSAHPEKYFSVLELSYRLGARRRFAADRLWAGPILHRMHMEGFLEANSLGEFRVKENGGHTTSFFKALEQPGVSLEDTTIITLDDVA